MTYDHMREKLPNSKESSGLHRNDIVGGISLWLLAYFQHHSQSLRVGTGASFQYICI